MQATRSGVRSGSLACRGVGGCVSAQFRLQVPKKSLAPTPFRKRVRTLCPEELSAMEAVTQGYGLARNATS
eukprot:6183812-Pleurochrysis_carterae.AAC.1